ncbi:putative Concanavalin A-like lectin/glucanase domain-containing protein [Seiridium cardinale]
MKAHSVSLIALLVDVALGGLARSDDRDCYLIDGPDAGYFQHRLFYDFRNVPIDGDSTYIVALAIVSEVEASGDGPVTNSDSNPYPFVYSNQHVYISRNTTDGSEHSTYLILPAVMEQTFLSASQIISTHADVLNLVGPSAELQALDNADTESDSFHLVDSGAVVGLFFYHSGTQETDINISMRDATTQICYSNQPFSSRQQIN